MVYNIVHMYLGAIYVPNSLVLSTVCQVQRLEEGLGEVPDIFLEWRGQYDSNGGVDFIENKTRVHNTSVPT